ncbi:transcriptional regulator [Vibrio parahaemolyticus]|uniref:helix-turn-helix domain-containing protein n=1 Tax=Vibrio parahaemolyticus TaxID=670 RepID=UPI00111FC452|nr:helix-turn-helix domain-containing protein [Vibrio parahaemolyticus]TOM58921.1 transcriptional regulator [Vibrio parahaemolyticus]TOM64717.1 transcriptional regulator [Vibrio parahaemolyticus]TOM73427.1 transcriptional regulator [Vibrio parahaemolyticus]TOO81773.1 transcriptional regulator [Vibrio parahaemolyticus]HCH4062400.1 helix-turn-helix domain-containing protein [Vibrio parahaemolyticus]
MNIARMKEFSNQMVEVMPWINGISTSEEYNELIKLMDELVEDYEDNHVLIDLLFPIIEKYESEADEFQEFNKAVDALDPGLAMLRVIIDQNDMTLSDFKDEIGAKSSVSMILNGTRSLTLRHIRALSERFNIPAHMFI